jgi:hypothetical protein
MRDDVEEGNRQWNMLNHTQPTTSCRLDSPASLNVQEVWRNCLRPCSGLSARTRGPAKWLLQTTARQVASGMSTKLVSLSPSKMISTLHCSLL